MTRLIGVGLEPLGLEEFLEGNFFDGELFVDEKKESFKKLGFKRMSFLQLFPAVFSKKSREAKAKADSMKLGGNLSGDGYQNGGCLVVGAGNRKRKEAGLRGDQLESQDMCSARFRGF